MNQTMIDFGAWSFDCGAESRIGVRVTGDKVVPVRAQIREHGIAVHREIVITPSGFESGAGYTATDTETGFAIGHDDTSDGAYRRAVRRLKVCAAERGTDWLGFLHTLRAQGRCARTACA